MKEIPLTQGFVALIDDDDFDLVSALKWRASPGKNGNTYAVTGYNLSARRRALGIKCNNPEIRMHRLITSCPDGMEVDHINCDGLDNRKANLRICSHRNNIARSRAVRGKSKTGYIGVRKQALAKSFYATCGSRYLGTFDSPEEAARARDAYALQEFGEFTVLNFPPEELLQ